ncbi:MAG TPA: hypothetical protein VIY08_04525 [Candidatus Nitrosocosmicus sp.]
MFIAERFRSKVVEASRINSISIDGGAWYPQACRLWKLKHHFHSTYKDCIVVLWKCFVA